MCFASKTNMFERNKMPCMSEESMFTVNSPFYPPSAFLLWCLLSQFTCFPFEMWQICDWKQPVSKNSMHVLSRDFCCIVTTLLPYCFHTQCKNSNHHQSLLFWFVGVDHREKSTRLLCTSLLDMVQLQRVLMPASHQTQLTESTRFAGCGTNRYFAS